MNIEKRIKHETVVVVDGKRNRWIRRQFLEEEEEEQVLGAGWQ